MACALEIRRSASCVQRAESPTELQLEHDTETHIETTTDLHAELQSPELAVPTHNPSDSSQPHTNLTSLNEPYPLSKRLNVNADELSSAITSTPNTSEEPHSIAESLRDRLPSATILPQLRTQQETSVPSTLNPVTISERCSVLEPSHTQQPASKDWKKFLSFSRSGNKLHSSSSQESARSAAPSHRSPVVSQKSSVSGSITSSSTPASSQVFSLLSLTSTRTSVDAEAIFLATTSTKMYLFSERPPLYVGKLRELPLPLEMETEWRDTVYRRLLGDLRCVLSLLPSKRNRAKTIIEPELRLVGEPDALTGLVELKPTVLIRCGCESYRSAVEKAVDDLKYLQAFSKGGVLVHRKAPKPASKESKLMSLDSSHYRADHVAQIVELAGPPTSSACGIRMRCTGFASMPEYETMCTVGGLIKIDDTVYGLTTGHSVLISAEEEDDSDSESESGSSADSGSDTNSMTSISSCDEVPSDEDDDSNAMPQNGTELRVESNAEATHWTHATLGPFRYLDHQGRIDATYPEPLPEASDFALIELPEDMHHLRNTYTSPQTPAHSTEIALTTDTASIHEVAGPVSVVCSPTDVRPAHLLEGDHGYLDRHAFFSTRKIQTMHPLEQGLSGAWVVRGTQLVGMILAVYDNEPYAHVLPILSIFADIRTDLSTMKHIPQVSLPTRTRHRIAWSHAYVSEESPEKSYLRYTPYPTPATPIPSPYRFLPSNNSLASHHGEEKSFSPLHSSFENDEFAIKQDWPVTAAVILAMFSIRLAHYVIPFILLQLADEVIGINLIGLCLAFHELAIFFAEPFVERLYRFSARGNWILICALLILQVAWLVCALAHVHWLFIVAHTLAGIGTSMVEKVSMILGKRVYHDCNTRIYSYGLEALSWIALLIAPFVAGALSDQYTWRACFVLNIIIGMISMVVISCNYRRVLLDSRAHDFGPSGVMLKHLAATCMFIPLLVLLTVVPNHGWGPTLAIACYVPVAGAAFTSLVTQYRLGFSLWERGSQLSYLHALMKNVTGPIVMVYIPMWFQSVKGASVVSSGTMFLAVTIPLLFGSLVSRLGVFSHWAFSGYLTSMALSAIAVGLLTRFTPTTEQAYWVPSLVAFGLGAGMRVNFARLCKTFYQFGSQRHNPLLKAVGLAVAHTLFLSRYHQSSSSDNSQASKPTVSSDHILNIASNSTSQTESQAPMDYNRALTSTFWLLVVVNGLLPLLVCTVFLVSGASGTWRLYWQGRSERKRAERYWLERGQARRS